MKDSPAYRYMQQAYEIEKKIASGEITGDEALDQTAVIAKSATLEILDGIKADVESMITSYATGDIPSVIGTAVLVEKKFPSLVSSLVAQAHLNI